jgi:chromosome segregation ATPase
MIDKATIDRLVSLLQTVASAYDEVDAVVTARDRARLERDAIAKESARFKREFSDLQLEYGELRRQLTALNADIARRGQELQLIDQKIQTARQRAFGG